MSTAKLAKGQTVADTHARNALGDSFALTMSEGPASQTSYETHTTHTGNVFSSNLAMTASFLDDIEHVRIATENQIRNLVSDPKNENDSAKGLAGSSEALYFQVQLDRILEIEKDTIKELQRTMKKHPLGPFIKKTVGLGEKQAARLLAAIGDPTWNSKDKRPRRGPAELWAYCGFHVIDGKRPRRQKGVKSNWSNEAKMRARLCADSCIKQRHSPYRKFYDEARAAWADRETSDLHKHNHALSVVAKEILKDLFVEAKRLNTTNDS